jgi:hypothetical protein
MMLDLKISNTFLDAMFYLDESGLLFQMSLVDSSPCFALDGDQLQVSECRHLIVQDSDSSFDSLNAHGPLHRLPQITVAPYPVSHGGCNRICKGRTI